MLSARFKITIFLLTATTFATSPAFGQMQCAGRWRVLIETTSGTCQANEHSRAIKLKGNGQIELENPSSEFELSGSVSACQTVSLVITRGAEVAKGSGRITGDEARGTWAVTRPPSKQCSGTWYAKQH
jgi:hypothetical protein